MHDEEGFKAFLRSAPDLGLEIDRSVAPARPLGLGEGTASPASDQHGVGENESQE